MPLPFSTLAFASRPAMGSGPAGAAAGAPAGAAGSPILMALSCGRSPCTRTLPSWPAAMKVMPAVRTAAKALFSSSEFIGDGVLGNATDEWHRAPGGHGRQPHRDITEAAQVATHPGGEWRPEKAIVRPLGGSAELARAGPRRSGAPALSGRPIPGGPVSGGPASRAVPDHCRIGGGASMLVTAFSSG